MTKETAKKQPLTARAQSLTANNEKEPEAKKSPKPFLPEFLTKNKSAGRRIDIFRLIKFIYPLTLLLIVIALCLVMLFLYNNVYLTMSQAEIVSSLKAKVIEESVDFSKFSGIVKKIEAKKALQNWPYLNYLSSPFTYGARLSYPVPGQIIAPTESSTIPALTVENSSSTQKTTSTER